MIRIVARSFLYQCQLCPLRYRIRESYITFYSSLLLDFQVFGQMGSGSGCDKVFSKCFDMEKQWDDEGIVKAL